MQITTQLLALIAAAVVSVNAQASIPSLTPCIQSCLTGKGCDSITDLQCVCTNKSFQAAVQACLTSNCTPAEQATAGQLQAANCPAVTATSKAPTATPSKGAASGQAPLNQALFLGGALVVGGLLL